MPMSSGSTPLAQPAAYVFIDAAYLRAECQNRGWDWKAMNLARVAFHALQFGGNDFGPTHLRVARTFVYDAAEDEQVRDWLARNGRERDTHIRLG